MRNIFKAKRRPSFWPLSEEIRANVNELKSLVEARTDATSISPEDRRLLQGAINELKSAETVVDSGTHRKSPPGPHLTSAQLHFNTARSLWLRSLSPKAVASYLPGIVTLVRERLAPTDERRLAIEQISSDAHHGRITESDLIKIIDAAEAAQEASLREKLRAGSFVRIVTWTIVSLSLLAVTLAVLSSIRTNAVPLCFNAPLSGTQKYSVICPTRSGSPTVQDKLDKSTWRTVTPIDYLVVEVVGLAAAGIAATWALRKIRGTSTGYPILVALAVLKLPTGALTAVLGLLLMRGGFVPGLSALDSPAQIIAWAVIFGYSQELFTRFADRQGQEVLEAVRATTDPPPSGPSGPPPPFLTAPATSAAEGAASSPPDGPRGTGPPGDGA